MPIPEDIASPLSDDRGLNRAHGWDLKFCWLPKRCFLTDQQLWWKLAYRGQNILTGPGEPIVEDYWLEKHEFLIWRIKQAGKNNNRA